MDLQLSFSKTKLHRRLREAVSCMRYSVYKFNGGEIAFSKPLLYRRRDWACVMYVFLSAELLKGSLWNAVPVMVIAVFQRLCTKHCIFNHNFPMHGRIVLSST